MAIQKKPTTNILTACFALGIIFLLWQTFGTLESTSHAGRLPSYLLAPDQGPAANTTDQTADSSEAKSRASVSAGGPPKHAARGSSTTSIFKQ